MMLFELSNYKSGLGQGLRIFTFWILDLKGEGLKAWRMAHGVENMIYNLGQNILRYALCALLYAENPEPCLPRRPVPAKLAKAKTEALGAKTGTLEPRTFEP